MKRETVGVVAINKQTMSIEATKQKRNRRTKEQIEADKANQGRQSAMLALTVEKISGLLQANKDSIFDGDDKRIQIELTIDDSGVTIEMEYDKRVSLRATAELKDETPQLPLT
jgi:hypothetical protein